MVDFAGLVADRRTLTWRFSLPCCLGCVLQLIAARPVAADAAGEIHATARLASIITDSTGPVARRRPGTFIEKPPSLNEDI